MLRKKIFLLIFAAVMFFCFFSFTLASAETTKLKLRILPQDCAFDVIDVGTQQLLFLTPELCGVPPEVVPPPNVPNPTEPLPSIVNKPVELTVDQVEGGLDGPTQIIRWSVADPVLSSKEKFNPLFIPLLFVFVLCAFWFGIKKDSQKESSLHGRGERT